MSTDSVKGVLLLGAVVSVRRLRDRGGVPDLAKRLSGQALALVDERIEPTRWYPVGPFCELIDVDWRVAGHGEPGYLERQGEVAADRLFDRGTYQQLDFADRAGKVDSRNALARQAKLITTINGALYNFLSIQVDTHAAALQITYGNARSFGDCLIHTTVGFMNRINRRQGSKRSWTGRRVSPERIVFTMELPERLA